VNEPLVTIVTPSYNQALFLEATMRSVLEQDYPRIEYIIIDGGSTDSSMDIIKKYADRLACWISEKDRGQTDALNKGFKRATGDILAWINSDDTYEPGAIREAVEWLQARPEIGLVYGDANFIDDEGDWTISSSPDGLSSPAKRLCAYPPAGRFFPSRSLAAGGSARSVVLLRHGL
jgi:glycosyltransferase involved in cell wall biosynthesis